MVDPKNVRELYLYMDGKFLTIHAEIKNIKKIVWWLSSLIPLVISGGFMLFIKLF